MSNENWRDGDFDESYSYRKLPSTTPNDTAGKANTKRNIVITAVVVGTVSSLLTGFFVSRSSGLDDLSPPKNGEQASERYVTSLESRIDELFEKNKELANEVAEKQSRINGLDDAATKTSREIQLLKEEIQQLLDIQKDYYARGLLLKDLCKLSQDPYFTEGIISFPNIIACEKILSQD